MDVKFNEVEITATYSLNGSIAETFPVDELGNFWILFRKLSLGLRLEKEERLFQVEDIDYESSLFMADNGQSKRSTNDSQFDQIIFWKVMGSFRSQFENEINECSKLAIDEVLNEK